MSVTGDPLRNATSDRVRGPEKGFRFCLIPFLAQPDIDAIAREIYCPIEIRLASFDFDVGILLAYYFFDYLIPTWEVKMIRKPGRMIGSPIPSWFLVYE